MHRKSALLVSLLVLLAGVGGPVTADSAAQTDDRNPVVSVNGTSNYLAIHDDDVERQATTRSDVSLGTAIDADTTSLQSELLVIQFEQSFADASGEAEKTATVREVTDRVEQRKQTLERRNRIAVRSFATGTMSPAEFVEERARISTEASQLQTAIDTVKETSRADPRYSLSTPLETRLDNVGGELEVLHGPVSNSISQAMAGQMEGQNAYVEASETGYTVAYVADGLYFRETFLGDQHQANATDQFAAADGPRTAEAERHGYQYYPWLVNNSASPNTYGIGSSGIYRFTSGEMTAYIDGGTTNVFRESQRQRVDSMPVSNTVTNVNNSLRLRLNKTYETGPLEVSLHDNETGDPVNGSVLVNGDPAGHTGDDGRIWIVEPRGPDRIEATTDQGRNVSVYIPS